MTDNDHDAAVQRLLKRVEYLLDRFLSNYYHEEKDGVWEEGTFKEKAGGNVCSDCKYLTYLLERANEGWSLIWKGFVFPTSG